MTEHPIPFSGPMIQPILERRKTQTRRIIRLTKDGRDFRSPYGVPGDHLWVREAHAIVMKTAYWHDLSIPHRESPDGDYWAVYREGWERVQPGPWRPSIHMPRWASRIDLLNEGERIERVQEITHEDAILEGATLVPNTENLYYFTPDSAHRSCHAAQAFSHLWDKINKKRGYGWGKNPRVRVVTFKLLEVKE